MDAPDQWLFSYFFKKIGYFTTKFEKYDYLKKKSNFKYFLQSSSLNFIYFHMSDFTKNTSLNIKLKTNLKP